MTNPQSSLPRSHIRSDPLPTHSGWQSFAAGLFAPTMWVLSGVTLVYFYLMSSASASPGQDTGMLCMVVDEILNVIAPSLTLDGFKG